MINIPALAKFIFNIVDEKLGILGFIVSNYSSILTWNSGYFYTIFSILIINFLLLFIYKLVIKKSIKIVL